KGRRVGARLAGLAELPQGRGLAAAVAWRVRCRVRARRAAGRRSRPGAGPRRCHTRHDRSGPADGRGAAPRVARMNRAIALGLVIAAMVWMRLLGVSTTAASAGTALVLGFV